MKKFLMVLAIMAMATGVAEAQTKTFSFDNVSVDCLRIDPNTGIMGIYYKLTGDMDLAREKIYSANITNLLLNVAGRAEYDDYDYHYVLEKYIRIYFYLKDIAEQNQISIANDVRPLVNAEIVADDEAQL